jgi:hypothetical protein
MIIALLNKSTRYANNPTVLNQIAAAVNTQLVQHVVPAWKVQPWQCVYYPNEASVPADAYRLWILDNADQAQALGYHDQDPNGFPYGRVFVNPIIKSGGTDTSSANGVSVTVSHEVCEILGDPEVNAWRQSPSGTLVCQELCDPVEGDAYPVTVNGVKVFVSNFVYPAWFDAKPPKGARFDQMGTLTQPFTMSKGGYMILMTGGRVKNVFGSKEAELAHKDNESKSHAAARSSRRKAALKKKVQNPGQGLKEFLKNLVAKVKSFFS